jgi:hypothetical protein
MTDLTTATTDQLESLWGDCQVSGDYDLQDRVVDEMMTREWFCPEDYDLMWELQDRGFHCDPPTQEDVDAR